MKRIGLALLLAFAGSAASAEAKIILNSWEEAPLWATEREVAVELLQKAMGKATWDRLEASKRRYKIEWVEDADVLQATGASQQAIDSLGGYFEKDVNSKGSYSLYVSNSWIQRQIEKGLQKATNFSSLPEEEQTRRKYLASRLLALGIIAHESQHALEFEDKEVGFGEKLVAPGIHDKIAQDRYDEYKGYVAQGKLEGEKNPDIAALAKVGKWYSHLPAKFLIVEAGRAVEGKAPFPWEASDGKVARSSDRKTSAFLNELIALGGNEAAQQAGAATASGGDGAGAGGGEGSPGLEDPGIDLSGAESVCVNSVDSLWAGLDRQGEQETAYAKTTGKREPKPGKFGTDPTAKALDPEEDE